MMANRPNILFILADDQRFDTIHALGNDDIHTPNLDWLAESGTAFTHAHIPGGTSGAVCMPSRAMINSGKTLFHLYGAGQEIPKTDVTMGEQFLKNGYETFGIGKWHNGTESYARSFCSGDEIFFGGMWDHWNVPVNSYHEDGVYDHIVRTTPNFLHCNHPMDTIAERITAGKHSTELFTDAAVRFIEQPHEKPFFLYTAMLAPHDPRTMPEEFKKMYDPKKISLPENFMESHPFDFGINPAIGEDRDENLAAYPRTEQEVRQHIADYYAMISHIDANVGRMIDALRRTGQLENTIIVYTGDNGLAVGRHGLMGKQNLYEHSIRVPLILRGPGIPAGARRDAYVYLMDIYPTLCEFCGMGVPASVEGKSFLPTLLEDAPARETLYLAYTHLIRGMKDRRFKLLRYKNNPDCTQLFDLQNDPNELCNLYHDESYRAVRDSLEKQLFSAHRIYEDNPENECTRAFWQE